VSVCGMMEDMCVCLWYDGGYVSVCGMMEDLWWPLSVNTHDDMERPANSGRQLLFKRIQSYQ
jgi:hypothetical protein